MVSQPDMYPSYQWRKAALDEADRAAAEDSRKNDP